MPSIRMVTQMIKRHDQLMSVDLLDAYSHAKIRQCDCPKLQFMFEGQLYMSQVLPNDIAIGPRFFVQMTKSIASFLRQKGVQIVIYIDDTLVVANNKTQAMKDHDLVIDTLERCGFMINYKKSHLNPSTVIEFLGFVLDSDNMTITLTEHKRQVLWEAIQAVLI